MTKGPPRKKKPIPPKEGDIVYYTGDPTQSLWHIVKNDFGWEYPPFMRMNENAVFMIAAALANNIFRGMVVLFKKFVPELRLNARLREFQFFFINVACALINNQYVFYDPDIPYDELMK